MNLLDKSIYPESEKFGKALGLISGFLAMDLKYSKVPLDWLKEATITFEFNAEYEHIFHNFGSDLGGKPSMCTVDITTDLGKIYTKQYGCNVWIHNPKREQRRGGF